MKPGDSLMRNVLLGCLCFAAAIRRKVLGQGHPDYQASAQYLEHARKKLEEAAAQ
ncbi:hypothetical protein ACFL4W_02275 [Planctomycetota bacterium]